MSNHCFHVRGLGTVVMVENIDFSNAEGLLDVLGIDDDVSQNK